MDASADTAPAVRPLLARLEQRLSELDRLHHEISADAQALAQAVAASVEAGEHRSVFSIRDAAVELGVSVSMLHKLLKERQLGYLKVGARTLITAEHLAQFRAASEVSAPTTTGDGAGGTRGRSVSRQVSVGAL